jgi:hypothetical protein
MAKLKPLALDELLLLHIGRPKAAIPLSIPQWPEGSLKA